MASKFGKCLDCDVRYRIGSLLRVGENNFDDYSLTMIR
jgi:hypothetical protein